MLVVFTIDRFELNGYPSQDENFVIPLVMSMFLSILKLVFKNRTMNFGMPAFQFPSWGESINVEGHLAEALQL